MKRRTQASPRPSSALTAIPAERFDQLYEIMDFVVVRAPLLPVDVYNALSRATQEEASAPAARDPLALLDRAPASRQASIRRALAVGSLALSNELERPASEGRDAVRARAKLLRYLIRMSTRPTPYGLFAGVALGKWSDHTDLALGEPVSRTRPDMGWLYSIVTTLEAREDVRRHLRFVANPTALIRAGRVFLAERAPSGEYSPPEVSVRATGAVQRALAAARRPISYVDLAQHLLESTLGATREKVDKLLAELWQQTLLLSDLRPPLTCTSPAQYVVDRLAGIPAAEGMREQMVGVLNAAARWDEDAGASADSVDAYRSVVEQARRVSQVETPLQVDMALDLAGRGLNRRVAEEAMTAVELLFRLSPWPQGIPSVDAYRRAFESRYGHDREVPLVELLDSQFGLGSLSNYGGAVGGISQQKQAQRTQTLLDLAQQALRDHQLVVELDAGTRAKLETWTPAAATAPLSVDLSILVAAASAAALDRGEFQIVVGPNLGAVAAGRNLGRFADMLAPEGPAALEKIAQAEENASEANGPERIWVELAYMPKHFHSANVVIRPAVRRYEIDLAVSPGVDVEQTIPLNELVVGVRAGADGSASRFYVRWPALNAEVVGCSGHMLNPTQSPPTCRFLNDVSRDGQAQFSGFDWGPAYGFPFLPRVQVGRIVLRPAEWRISAEMCARELPVDSPDTFRAALDRWRERWWAPRHLYLSLGDNRLLLDLDNAEQADQLREELKKLKDGGAVTFQEVIPALDENWLPGPGGRYAAEFVVSLVRKPQATPAADAAGERQSAQGLLTAAGAPESDGTGTRRLRPPGSEWLFLKLYAPRTWEDDLIASYMYPFAEQRCAAAEADSWFFIRYSDPEPHLRLRFHGMPERLMGQLFARACEWAGELMTDGVCQRFTFDTYDRELERYGGDAGTEVAEAIFAADSRAVAELLALFQSRAAPFGRPVLAMLSIDDLLASLGLDTGERLAWYREQAPDPHEVGDEYRQKKALFRLLLGDSHYLLSQLNGEAVAQIFATRRAALAPCARRLKELARAGELGQTLPVLCRSYVHLHLNRLVGGDAVAERRAIALLRRTREGLAQAPFVPRLAVFD